LAQMPLGFTQPCRYTAIANRAIGLECLPISQLVN
jgi:hypothetical protein